MPALLLRAFPVFALPMLAADSATPAAAAGPDYAWLATAGAAWLCVTVLACLCLWRGAFHWVANDGIVQAAVVMAAHVALFVFYLGGGTLLVVPAAEAAYLGVLFHPPVRNAFPEGALRGAGWLFAGLSVASVALVGLSLF